MAHPIQFLRQHTEFAIDFHAGHAVVLFQRGHQIGHGQFLQLSVPFKDGNALGLKGNASADACGQIEFEGVDGALNHGLICLWDVASEKLNRLLLATVRNHGTRPDGLERLLAIFLEGDPREFQAALEEGLLVLANGLRIVDGVQIHELERQPSVTCPGHPLQQRLHLCLEALPLLREFSGQIACDNDVVLKLLEQLRRPRRQRVPLFGGQIHVAVDQLAQHDQHGQHGCGQAQGRALAHQAAAPHRQSKPRNQHAQRHPRQKVQDIT